LAEGHDISIPRAVDGEREPPFVSPVVGKLVGWNLTLKVCDNID
jgi:hypothetical protein